MTSLASVCLRRCPLSSYRVYSVLVACGFARHYSFISNYYLERRKHFLTMAPKIYQGKADMHRGITINSSEFNSEDVTDFETNLDYSLQSWSAEGVRAVWFKVSVSHLQFVPVLIKKGFKIHHGLDETITLCCWLGKSEEIKIPDYAHYFIGAGAIVINPERQVLVVRERYRTISQWKLPGGHVDRGEDIVEAAIREVLEETAIQTEFVSLVAFRLGEKRDFPGCSDLYFLVRLKPTSSQIVREQSEILDSKWMNVDDYLTHPEVHENNRFFVQQALQNETDGVFMERQYGLHPTTKSPQYLYAIHRTTQDK